MIILSNPKIDVIPVADNFTDGNKPVVPTCPCGEKRMQGIIVGFK